MINNTTYIRSQQLKWLTALLANQVEGSVKMVQSELVWRVGVGCSLFPLLSHREKKKTRYSTEQAVTELLRLPIKYVFTLPFTELKCYNSGQR